MSSNQLTDAPSEFKIERISTKNMIHKSHFNSQENSPSPSGNVSLRNYPEGNTETNYGKNATIIEQMIFLSLIQTGLPLRLESGSSWFR